MGLFILLLAASSLLVNRFRLEHPLLVSFPALILTTSIVLNYRHSLLQGRQDFTRLSLLGIINAFNRLILALGFAYLGFGVAGALGGFVLAQLIGITLAYFLTRKLLSRRPLFSFRADASLRRELAYGFTVLLASGAIAFFGSFDVVIIKYLFPAYESGLYSGIATIGRIIYFAAGPVAGVLLASVRLDATQEDNRKLLRKALAFMAALCLPLLLVFCVWPEMVIHLMIGERYLSLAYLLPYLSLLMLLLSLLNVFVMYALALRRKWLRLLSVSAVALTVVLLFVLPVSFISVLVSLGGGTILMLLGIIFYER